MTEHADRGPEHLEHGGLVPVDLEALRSVFGLGVAGNFAGHLEQAGEAGDFVNVDAAAQMPKGVFPWYAPGDASFLGEFPLDPRELRLPAGDHRAQVQIEPELGVLFDVVRGGGEGDDAEGPVTGLRPRWAAAFDDCSVRRPGARRISEKKNWGAASKGVAPRAFALDDLEPGGALANLRIACMLRRDGETHAYGVDSGAPTYTLIGAPLEAWLVDRLTTQRGSDDTPLEDVGALLAACSPPVTQVLVGIGATRYEPLGETTYLEAGDEAIVVVYDSRVHEPGAVAEAVAGGRDNALSAASVLRRVVIAPR